MYIEPKKSGFDDINACHRLIIDAHQEVIKVCQVASRKYTLQFVTPKSPVQVVCMCVQSETRRTQSEGTAEVYLVSLPPPARCAPTSITGIAGVVPDTARPNGAFPVLLPADCL
jgi:hypothetical protein